MVNSITVDTIAFICSRIYVHCTVDFYICFISFLYLDVYILGDDASINRDLSCDPNIYVTQVNRMSRSRRVLAIGGKQRIFGLDMVCIETILFHLDSF